MSDVSFNSWKLKDQPIDKDDYEIVHYENNGGVVMRGRDRDQEVISFIHCSFLGYTKEQNADPEMWVEIGTKAEAFFIKMIEIHNTALAYGEAKGRGDKLREIRKALGIGK